ncbi:hypothetical protein A2U01_0082669, partial [Trifolium medium]|nr:hypothetical protein [Trifolium medium]
TNSDDDASKGEKRKKKKSEDDRISLLIPGKGEGISGEVTSEGDMAVSQPGAKKKKIMTRGIKSRTMGLTHNSAQDGTTTPSEGT